MRLRVHHSFLVLLLIGGTATAAGGEDVVQLGLPPALAESLAWHQDPESVLRAFRVPRRSLEPRGGDRMAPSIESRVAGAVAAPISRRPAPLVDVPVAADEALEELQPSLVASPVRQDTLAVAYVAAGHTTSPGARCLVARSIDRGRTWTRRVQLPTLSPSSNCGDPALAYSPDGRRLYAAYRDILSTQEFLPDDPTLLRVETATHIVVSRSWDDGRTWSAPVIALRATPYTVDYDCPGGAGTCGATPVDWTAGTSFERPSIAVGGAAPRGRFAPARARVVHVASTRMAELDDLAAPTTVVATRSLNDGRSWSDPHVLDAGLPSGPRVITQGPSITAAGFSEALIAWYHSGFDGWLTGGFEIRTARSGDAGATWGPIAIAADEWGETPFRLAAYRKWWTTMLPQAALDDDGRAHVVYTYDPEPGSATAEDGDVRHVASPTSPWSDWSDPVTVNDDGPGRAQGFPGLVTWQRGRRPFVEVVWEDTRLAPGGATADQLSLYDIFRARLDPGDTAGWSVNTRVSDVSSTQTLTFSPGRTTVGANRTGVVFAAWGDRRGVASPSDRASDVYASRIDPR